MDYSLISPFIDLFSRSQCQAILFAWLPSKLSPYLTGIMAVDMFILTVVSSGITTSLYLLYNLVIYLLFTNKNPKNRIFLQIDYFNLGQYNDRTKNLLHEALSWLISENVKKSVTGSFTISELPNVSNKDRASIPDTIMLPMNEHEMTVKFNKMSFRVKFKFPDNSNTPNFKRIDYYNTPLNYTQLTNNNDKPSIYLNVDQYNVTMNEVSELLSKITNAYLDQQQKSKARFRYENNQCRWVQIQKLMSCRGLDSVALDDKQEILLLKELNTFANNKTFYEKIAMPYKRGFLLYGRPGTGKTTLINAISSHLFRNTYHLNLKMVKDDNELKSLISSIPPNQLIIFEDVDAQSKTIHNRSTCTSEKILNNELTENDLLKENKPNFSLSTFLECLDGHILSEGNIIIMTTNHIEMLDPACIRTGRMDVKIELGYCTHYQINKLYKTVIDESGIPGNKLKLIREKAFSPSEVMTLLSLYSKDNPETIIQKLIELSQRSSTNTDNEFANF